MGRDLVQSEEETERWQSAAFKLSTLRRPVVGIFLFWGGRKEQLSQKEGPACAGPLTMNNCQQRDLCGVAAPTLSRNELPYFFALPGDHDHFHFIDLFGFIAFFNLLDKVPVHVFDIP